MIAIVLAHLTLFFSGHGCFTPPGQPGVPPFVPNQHSALTVVLLLLDSQEYVVCPRVFLSCETMCVWHRPLGQPSSIFSVLRVFVFLCSDGSCQLIFCLDDCPVWISNATPCASACCCRGACASQIDLVISDRFQVPRRPKRDKSSSSDLTLGEHDCRHRRPQ